MGDIVILNTGEEVPADGELVETVSLEINESTLTGEPVIHKTTDESEFDSEATYPSNAALRGTTIVDGHGMMEVRAVGDATEYGKVYKGAQIDNSVQTPLNQQLTKLARLITMGSYGVALLIVVGRLVSYFASGVDFEWLSFGTYVLNTLMIAVTLIVVAVPEGLPMSVTLSLAMSMKRMLTTNNLVRKMHACETMGATTVICTDKTGTLTQNQMNIAQTRFLIDDERLIDEAIAVNSTAFLDYNNPDRVQALGNPTEGALLLWLHSKGVNYLPIRENTHVVEQLTFSTERKYMATIVDSNVAGKRVLYVKGAPEIVLNMCAKVSVEKSEVEAQLLDYQSKAMRTLGFAYQILEDSDGHIYDGGLHNVELTFMGIVAISDPVRADVPAAIGRCMEAGIDVVIVTGDTSGTAKEIGRQIGLWKDDESEEHHITGVEFAELSDEELRRRVLDLKIISRARPMDKQRLVQMLQSLGQVVAVTGDGTNDAPALKAAQVGLSMGDGTSVAKEASDITILDNSFSSITRAVMWGRSLYQNIRRFVLFQMTINVAACLIVLIGAFLGTESPLTVTQMLWVNLIMDTFAALALASLPPNESVMRDKPRKPTDSIVNRSMGRQIIGIGFAFVVVLFGLLQYFKHVDVTSLADFSIVDFGRYYFDFSGGHGGLSPYELSMFFTFFVMMQFWNLFNAKAFASRGSAFAKFILSRGFMLITVLILGGQLLITTFGGGMFSVVPLRVVDWLIIIGVTSLVLWFGELERIFKGSKSKKRV